MSRADGECPSFVLIRKFHSDSDSPYAFCKQTPPLICIKLLAETRQTQTYTFAFANRFWFIMKNEFDVSLTAEFVQIFINNLTITAASCASSYILPVRYSAYAIRRGPKIGRARICLTFKQPYDTACPRIRRPFDTQSNEHWTIRRSNRQRGSNRDQHVIVIYSANSQMVTIGIISASIHPPPHPSFGICK